MLEKNDNWAMLEQFFKKPLYAFHLRELCRILKWSPTKARKNLNILKKRDLITESREKNLSIFRTNKESEAFRELKIIYSIKNAFEISRIIEKNVDDFEAIVLFGSARRGEDTESSDIDIGIVGAKEVDIDLKEIEKRMGRRVSLLYIGSLKKLIKENKELSNNIFNGFVLKGYLKVL